MERGEIALGADRWLTARDWRGYRRDDFPAASWVVEKDRLGAIAGAEPVSLISRERFGDFDLSFDWRVAVGGNSGVLYRVTEEEDEPWQTGPEMQLLDNANHPDGRVPETSCGALYGILAPRQAPPCPAGLFNVARIRMTGTRIEHWLNGVQVLSCDLADADLRERIARSKFRDCPRFARAPAGHIVLQHHGTDAAFYNLRIDA